MPEPYNSPLPLLGLIEHYWQTLKHKAWVFYYMWRLYPAISHEVSWRDWLWRSIRHDFSKFGWYEAQGFARVIRGFGSVMYGSPEYKARTRLIRPAIQHHYDHNDHHPQHWGGYRLMPLVAQRELICDWAAAVRRNVQGDLRKSINQNGERFKYGSIEANELHGLADRLLDDDRQSWYTGRS